MVKFIFFDFGGCIDSGGVHTRTLFWNAFLAQKLVREEGRKEFQEAYTKADDQMMKTGIAKKMELRNFNRLTATLIAADLHLASPLTMEAADSVTTIMTKYLEKNALILERLAARMPLGIISNFTGNLEVILNEFDLRKYFHSVTESFYVGASKPDRKIFEAALATQHFLPNECIFIGDNPKNDIYPGLDMGMKCVLIHERGKKQECGANAYVEDLGELEGLIQSI